LYVYCCRSTLRSFAVRLKYIFTIHSYNILHLHVRLLLKTTIITRAIIYYKAKAGQISVFNPLKYKYTISDIITSIVVLYVIQPWPKLCQVHDLVTCADPIRVKITLWYIIGIHVNCRVPCTKSPKHLSRRVAVVVSRKFPLHNNVIIFYIIENVISRLMFVAVRESIEFFTDF